MPKGSSEQDDSCNPQKEDKMGDFGYVILIIFIIIRILIAAGLFYLIVVEIRRYRRRSETKNREAHENAGGKDADDSNGSRS